jgi:hypothetical protein
VEWLNPSDIKNNMHRMNLMLKNLKTIYIPPSSADMENTRKSYTLVNSKSCSDMENNMHGMNLMLKNLKTIYIPPSFTDMENDIY